MGAFDGFTIPCQRVPSSPTTCYQRFPNYTFSFFKGFGEAELKNLLSKALADNSETVWVPQKNGSSIGLETWYVKALVEHHFGDK